MNTAALPQEQEPIFYKSERLSFRRLTLADAPIMLALLNEPAFIEYIGDRQVRTLEQAQSNLQNGPLANYQKYGFGIYLVMLRESGEVIGTCGFVQRYFLPMPDLGYAFFQQYYGCGYATEAAKAMLAYGRNELGIALVAGFVTPTHITSKKILSKIGFTLRGQFFHPDSHEWLDFYLEKDGNLPKIEILWRDLPAASPND